MEPISSSSSDWAAADAGRADAGRADTGSAELTPPLHLAAAPRPSYLSETAFGLDEVVASSEPSIVFTSLARMSVPVLADACSVTISEAGNLAYGIAVPSSRCDCAPDAATVQGLLDRGEPQQVITAHAVHTVIGAHPATDDQDFRGVVSHEWATGNGPSRRDAALALLLVQLAVALISQERVADRESDKQREISNLHAALETSREIGAATGILMATRHLDRAAAFELLRQTSQDRNRKLRDLASDVVFTGTMELPAGGYGRG